MKIKSRKGSWLTNEQAIECHMIFKSIQTQEGKLTAKAVVEEARAEDSPLHKYFTWDPEVAHNKYLLIEAGRLIGEVREVVKIAIGEGGLEKCEEKKMWVRVIETKHETEGTPIYIEHSEAEETEEYRNQRIKEAKRALRTWVREYQWYDELVEIVGFLRDKLEMNKIKKEKEKIKIKKAA